MTRWFTSDWHLGHKNIIYFCDRPFDNVDWMNESIIDTMNTHVGPDDELWILGDVGMGNVDKTLPMLKRLTAGRVVVVAGNHDRCHPYNGKKHEGWIARYENLTGAEIICGNTELTLADGTEVQVSHFPYSMDGGYGPYRPDDRAAEWRPVDDGRWLLCGHAHEKWQQYQRTINVGIDAWAGVPITEQQILDRIAEGPQNLYPSERWSACLTSS